MKYCELPKEGLLVKLPDFKFEDGVQGIEDTFFDWFIVNSECETVNVKRIANGVENHKLTYGYKIYNPREGVEKIVSKKPILYDESDERVRLREVLTNLSLVNPVHLKMTSDGYGEFPDGYKLTEKGIQYVMEQIKKK